MNIKKIDIFQLEESIWVANQKIDVSSYDFTFEPLFACRRPYQTPKQAEVICRIGVFEEYQKTYQEFQKLGFTLINSYQEHRNASELPFWYPLIKSYTPRSVCYSTVPSAQQIEKDFQYPVFIKGARQTARHIETLSVAKNRNDCEMILDAYKNNPILHWQQLVCREFIDLVPVKGSTGDKINASFEFRSFWYKNQHIASGPYWSEFSVYDWSKEQKKEALALASHVAELVNVPFLVIDLALTKENKWIVIECNDAQESGYAGISPILLWKNLLKIERDF